MSPVEAGFSVVFGNPTYGTSVVFEYFQHGRSDMKTMFGATVLALVSSPALAGAVQPIPISEPGMVGLFAVGVVAAVAIVRARRK